MTHERWGVMIDEVRIAPVGIRVAACFERGPAPPPSGAAALSGAIGPDGVRACSGGCRSGW